MNTIATYIFVHDQHIVLDAEKTSKFKALSNIHYIYLGSGSVDKISDKANVIIARNLKHNIEQYPKFCSFTGWYALWKNNLIQTDYVHLLEYDISISDNFKEVTLSLIKEKYDFIGYAPLPISFGLMSPSKYLDNLLYAIEKHYNVYIKQMMIDIKKDKNKEWSSTSNSTFSGKVFNEYMTWFEILIDSLKDSDMSGHAHERSITFFYLIFCKRVILMKGLIKHEMLNSHGT